MTHSAPNAETIEAWNTVLFDKFTRFRDVAAGALGVHGDDAIARLSFVPGLRVVDLGCGFGDSTRELARRVGSRGIAVGIDAAPRFIEVAQRESAGIEQLRFRIADVQTASLDGPFDIAYSRMGTTFFAQPLAAMRNVARALVPDGLLSIIVWRRREANAWVHIAEEIVARHLAEHLAPDSAASEPPASPSTTAAGPGPFSMADPDLVSDQLQSAGFGDVSFRRHDADLVIGKDLDEAIAFSLALGPAGEHMRRAGERAEAHRDAIVTALRDAFAPHVTANGVRLASSTWNITARRL